VALLHHKKFLALFGAIVAVLFAPAAAPAASGTTVTVRVEGLKRTLSASTVVHTKTGWITKAGTPSGQCPAASAAGALDLATRHRWDGSYSSTLGLEITTILGETHAFSSPYFWSIWVDNKFAPAGACGLKLHRGEQLLFAAVPIKGTTYPTAIRAPRSANAGHAFTVTVVWFNGKGKARPLAGASVDGKKTDSRGSVQIIPTQAGTLTLHAGKAGFIRAAAVQVRVLA